MDSKKKYKNKEKEIQNHISAYSATSKNNRSEVIYCFDCDNYDTSYEDKSFLEIVKQYCEQKGYDFVWFCKDIEQVYWGEAIEDRKKHEAAVKFKGKSLIKRFDISKLMGNSYRKNTSNLAKILDKYLSRKSGT